MRNGHIREQGGAILTERLKQVRHGRLRHQSSRFLSLFTCHPELTSASAFTSVSVLLSVLGFTSARVSTRASTIALAFTSLTVRLLSRAQPLMTSHLIKLPTRIGKTSSTLLDSILTNNTRRIFSSGVVDAHISDHSLIHTILRTTAPRLRSRKIQLRSLKNFDQDLFLRDLHNVPFHVMEVFDDIDDKQYVFESLYLDILNEHAPQKQAYLRGFLSFFLSFHERTMA